jgi:hypothetical protein
MQNQEHMQYDYEAETTPPASQRTTNTDPREQSQEQAYSYSAYEEGYSRRDASDVWNYGEKAQPSSSNRRSPQNVLALVVIICVALIVGSHFGIIVGWLSWIVVSVLIAAGLIALASNWRVVSVPLPTRTFQISEHARLILNSNSGEVIIRRGTEGVITVNGTKRASGIGVDVEHIDVGMQQNGDTVDISTHVDWNFLQFGLRSVNFEVTVPASCDVQLSTGSGRVLVQDTSGDIRVRTGSGGIEANNLQGQVALKTGSGGIRCRSIQGDLLIQTGSGGVRLDTIQGPAVVRTGSGGITMGQSSLAGISRISTGSGGITFDGSIDPRSNIEMRTGSGGIVLQLPADAAFTLDAHTGSGGVHNAFGGKEVGDGPRALLRLRTGSGGIHVRQM